MSTTPSPARLLNIMQSTSPSPRRQHEALMAAAKALIDVMHCIGLCSSADEFPEIQKAKEALAALRAAGIHEGEGK
jgi:hypothetical protein